MTETKTDLCISLHLSEPEAHGLADLCHVLGWEFLAEHELLSGQTIEARYALAKLRFALSDAGFPAMPEKETRQATESDGQHG